MPFRICILLLTVTFLILQHLVFHFERIGTDIVNTTEKSLERQVQLWSMPGPAAILFTLFVIFFTSPSQGLAFPLIAIAGFLASWFWKVRGTALCLPLLIVLGGIYLLALGVQHLFWIVGVACALALAWTITALSREEIDGFLVRPEPSQPEPIIQKIIVTETKIDEEAQVRLAETQKHVIALQEEIGKLQQQVEYYPLEIKQLQDDLLNEKKSNVEFLAGKEAVIGKLQVDIENIRREKEQLQQQMKEVEEAKDTVVWGDSSTKEGRALCQIQGKYLQLRDQYEEKSNQLDNTRKELFLLQEAVEVIKKEREEEIVYGEHRSEKAMLEYLAMLSQSIDRLEKENLVLEGIIDRSFFPSG